jgi:hypothetical protein
MQRTKALYKEFKFDYRVEEEIIITIVDPVEHRMREYIERTAAVGAAVKLRLLLDDSLGLSPEDIGPGPIRQPQTGRTFHRAGGSAMSADIINLPPPPKLTRPLPEAAAQAIRMLRYEIGQLENRKRVITTHLIGWLGHIIVELECGLRHEADEATGELSDDLMAALRSNITVAEINGARNILELILDALPDYRGIDGAA